MTPMQGHMVESKLEKSVDKVENFTGCPKCAGQREKRGTNRRGPGGRGIGLSFFAKREEEEREEQRHAEALLRRLTQEHKPQTGVLELVLGSQRRRLGDGNDL